jgi:hypothetical protein
MRVGYATPITGVLETALAELDLPPELIGTHAPAVGRQLQAVSSSGS